MMDKTKEFQEYHLRVKREDALALMKKSAEKLRHWASDVDRYVAQFETITKDGQVSNVSEVDVMTWCANHLANLSQNLDMSDYIRLAVALQVAKNSATQV